MTSGDKNHTCHTRRRKSKTRGQKKKKREREERETDVELKAHFISVSLVFPIESGTPPGLEMLAEPL